MADREMTAAGNRSQWDILGELRGSPRIFERLREADAGELHLQKELRRDYPDDVVRAALSLEENRARGRAKFTRADEMWFDRRGLEQATSEEIARHKARRFDGLIWDMCCGMGGDSLALAEQGRVVAVDSNPVACRYTQWNAEVYGVADRVQSVCADVERLFDRSGLVHIDPDRRGKRGTRSRRVEESVPGLPFLNRLVQEFGGGAVKLSPASNFAGKFDDVEYELISLRGECKEAVVWFGSLRSGQPWRATVLPSGETLAGDPLDYRAELSPLSKYLYDPDPSIVRAGLVDMLGEQWELGRLDDTEEYLTSDEPVDTSFARRFEVLAELPNNHREVRRYFREEKFGQVEIKCRHIPIDAEAVRRKLPLEGTEPAVLVFARIAGKSRAIVCRRAD